MTNTIQPKRTAQNALGRQGTSGPAKDTKAQRETTLPASTFQKPDLPARKTSASNATTAGHKTRPRSQGTNVSLKGMLMVGLTLAGRAAAEATAPQRDNHALMPVTPPVDLPPVEVVSVEKPGESLNPVASVASVIASAVSAVASSGLSGLNGLGAMAGLVASEPPLKTLEMLPEFRNENTVGQPLMINGMKVGDMPPVHYMSEAERAQCKLTVKDGLIYKANGELFDTHTLKPGEFQQDRFQAILVMDKERNLYATNHYNSMISTLRHSSFLSGGPVAAAAQIEVVEGRLVAGNGRSGHYHPTKENNLQLLEVFESQGVDMDEVDFEHDHVKAAEKHRLRMEPIIAKAMEEERWSDELGRQRRSDPVIEEPSPTPVPTGSISSKDGTEAVKTGPLFDLGAGAGIASALAGRLAPEGAQQEGQEDSAPTVGPSVPRQALPLTTGQADANGITGKKASINTWTPAAPGANAHASPAVPKTEKKDKPASAEGTKLSTLSPGPGMVALDQFPTMTSVLQPSAARPTTVVAQGDRGAPAPVLTADPPLPGAIPNADHGARS